MSMFFLLSFGLALSSINLYMGHIVNKDIVAISLFAGTGKFFSWLHWEHELTHDCPLSPLQNARCFNASWFGIKTSAADFNSTGSAKLPFFQKAAAVVVIVDLTCIKDCLKQRNGAYA